MWQRFSNLLELDLWVFINLSLNECKIFDLWKRRNKFLIDRDRYSEYLNRGRSVNKLALQVCSDLSLPSSLTIFTFAGFECGQSDISVSGRKRDKSDVCLNVLWPSRVAYLLFSWKNWTRIIWHFGMFVSIYFLFNCSNKIYLS